MTKDQIRQLVDKLPDSFIGILIPASSNPELYFRTIQAELIRLHMRIHGSREEACNAIGISSRQERNNAADRTLSFGLDELCTPDH